MIILFLGELSVSLVNLYTHTTLWYTWNKNVPNPSLFTSTLTNKVLGKIWHPGEFSLPPLPPAEHVLCSVQL